jgi:hypothetical protein
MYFDAPGRPLVRTGISRFEGALIFLAAALVSPLGYFLIGSLTTMTDNAAGSLF